MRETILIFDLTEQTVERQEYNFDDEMTYGRMLALKLLEEFAEPRAGRLDPGNAIVLVPGLFTGSPAPSAGRIFLATQRNGMNGAEICNITGNLPESLGSKGIAAVVITGKYPKGNGIIHIGADSWTIDNLPGASGQETARIIRAIRAVYGKDSAAIGIGAAGERQLAISSVFSTYSEGYPEYYIPRNAFGDVFGAKGLRAVVVEGSADSADQMMRPMKDSESFIRYGTELANIIRQNEICGNALPSYGAEIMLQGLEDKSVFCKFKADTRKEIGDLTEFNNTRHACTPLCVIGCLNQHVGRRKKEHYKDPLTMETSALIARYFGIHDPDLTKDVVERMDSMGIAAAEFIDTAHTYSVYTDIRVTPKKLRDWMGEIEKDSVIGRLLGGGMPALDWLFPNQVTKTQRRRMDVMADADESLRNQENALDNLGFCVFAAFAIIDNPDAWVILARMMEARIGGEWTEEKLLRQGRESMEAEIHFCEERVRSSFTPDLPKFLHVIKKYKKIKA